MRRRLRRLAQEFGKAAEVMGVGIDRGLLKVAQSYVVGHALSKFGDA